MNKIPVELEIEQNQIINSCHNKIVVSAGPGSGKTHTIVNRITKELISLNDDKGVIACSFTKEASRQLLDKISAKTDVKKSFIGTIDSFIMQEVIMPFVNRGFNNETSLDKEKIKIRISNDQLTFSLTKAGETMDRKTINDYYKKWVNDLKNEIYSISFAAYIHAANMLKNTNIIKEYLSSTYSTIYIDEAQDLNFYQHMFLDFLIELCEINCVMIGDANQSIYSFRGARPNLFYKLIEKGFVEYKLSYSVRCNKNILDFSNKIINDNNQIINVNSDFVKIDTFNIEEIRNLKSTYFLLFEEKKRALSCFNYMKNQNINVIYTVPLELCNSDFNDNYLDLIQESLRFYLNFKNQKSKLVYSIEDFIDYLSIYVDTNVLTINIIEKNMKSPYFFVEYIFNAANIDIPEDVKSQLVKDLENESILNHYRRFSDVNRIMTIHGSKGLEAEGVYVILQQEQYNLDEEYRRKLYVAFTRAKSKLTIIFDKKLIGKKVYRYLDGILNMNKENN